MSIYSDVQSNLEFFLIVVIGVVASVWARKLTLMAALTGAVIGSLIYFSSGWVGIVMMCLFFLLGTLATSWNHRLKESLHIAEKDKGRRDAWQVGANAGVAGMIAIFILIYPGQQNILLVMMAATFSSATADTISSEMGSVYGTRFYNILTWKKDQRGKDGVISLEGCIWGLAGSIMIAMSYAFFNEWDNRFIIIIVAGTLGNLFDSFLGAAFERKGWIKNNAVNFLNTLFAAAVAGLLCPLFT